MPGWSGTSSSSQWTQRRTLAAACAASREDFGNNREPIVTVAEFGRDRDPEPVITGSAVVLSTPHEN
ncbi:MAG: hypothetical protein V5A38_08840 [Halolamina sp.]|uniref:hypothetical protein n=1 Tax=Halolamina sp. TaxID=1940283 RepID=UPI002FC2C8D2